jgi:tRNA A-37 threonylcarbamoyl transferase component Bud32
MIARTINNIDWRLIDDDLTAVLPGVAVGDENKREYRKFAYKGGAIFVKSFTEKGLSGFARNLVLPRGKKEYLLGMRLLSLSIPTPRPLGYGISSMGSFVIQEWLEGKSFSLLWKEEPGRRERLLAGLARLLRGLKEHRVRHNDLHLDNILVGDDRLYLIDLHKMQIKRVFGVSDEASNLSHALVSVYNEMKEEEKESFFSLYGSMGVRGRLEGEIGRLTARWFRKKMERAFESTSMITVAGNRLYVTGTEGEAKGQFLELIKEDTKVRVERYSDHIRKHYRDARRLKRAWKAHVVFRYMDLPAVPRAFYLQMPASGEKGYIAMEDLKSRGEELDRYLDRYYDEMTFGQRKAFIDGLARLFDGLLKWGIMHKDLKGCNIFVFRDGGFTLLDTEDIVFDSLNRESVKRMFLQMNTTVPKRIAMGDRMRFFVRITSFLAIDHKALFRRLLWESKGKEIVYEGKDGLVRDRW